MLVNGLLIGLRGLELTVLMKTVIPVSVHPGLSG